MEEQKIRDVSTDIFMLNGENNFAGDQETMWEVGAGVVPDMMGTAVSLDMTALVEEVETLRAELARMKRLVEDPLPTYYEIQEQERTSSSDETGIIQQ